MNIKLLFCSLAIASICPQILLLALPSEATSIGSEIQNDSQIEPSPSGSPVLPKIAQVTSPEVTNPPAKPLFDSKITITGKNGKTRVAQQVPVPLPSQVPVTTPPVQPLPPLPGRVQGVVPPFQRRPIPAPSGDISVGTFSLKPETVDLGSSERVPRISLREAPVRDVLTLIARVAGLNVAFADESAPGAAPTTPTTSGGPRISLDIENETAQDVFNSVLRLSNLDASRIGRTIFIATKLPINLKNIVTRSYRLNQISVGEASGFLLGLGAERTVNRQRPIPGVTTAQVGTAGGVTNLTIPTETIPTLESLTPSATSILPLKGLQIAAEERSNSLTLIGSPSLVDFASAQLGRLDSRKRQVSVNVRIVDVQLQGAQQQNASASFGIGDSFFTFDNGAAVVNFGQFRPPTSAESSGSLTNNPTTVNPFSGANTFINLNGQTFLVPGTTPGLTVNGFVQTQPGVGEFLPRVPGVNSNPLIPGVTDITRATNDAITTTVTNGVVTTTGTAGTVGTITQALPSLFQFPSQFLARLQNNIANGNAKILTDPILTVQEGESAQVSLTQDVLVGTIQNNTTVNQVTTTTIQPNIQQAGLTLNINIARVDDNGFINMSISPSVTSPANIVQLGNGDTASLLSRRTLTSGQIRLRDNQTLILSGVIQDLDREVVSKVPFLSDLPIIGALFRSQRTEKTRNEVVIVVTPRIIDDSDRAQFGYTYQPGPEVQKILDSNRVPATPPQR
jgi:type IV pilus assembly protein PilQ